MHFWSSLNMSLLIPERHNGAKENEGFLTFAEKQAKKPKKTLTLYRFCFIKTVRLDYTVMRMEKLTEK